MASSCLRSEAQPPSSSYCCPYGLLSDDRARYCVDWLATVEAHKQVARTASCPPIAEACELEACRATSTSRRLRRLGSATHPPKRTLIRTNPWVSPSATAPVNCSCQAGALAIDRIAANVLASFRTPPVKHLLRSAPGNSRRSAAWDSHRLHQCESRASVSSDTTSSDGYHSSCSKDIYSSSCQQETTLARSRDVQSRQHSLMHESSDADDVFSSLSGNASDQQALSRGDIMAEDSRWRLLCTPTEAACRGESGIHHLSNKQSSLSNLEARRVPSRVRLSDGRSRHLPGKSNAPTSFSSCANAHYSRLEILPFTYVNFRNAEATPPPPNMSASVFHKWRGQRSPEHGDWRCSYEPACNADRSVPLKVRQKELTASAGGSSCPNDERDVSQRERVALHEEEEPCERRLTLSEKVHRLCASRDAIREIIRLAKVECEHLATDPSAIAVSEFLP